MSATGEDGAVESATAHDVIALDETFNGAGRSGTPESIWATFRDYTLRVEEAGKPTKEEMTLKGKQYTIVPGMHDKNRMPIVFRGPILWGTSNDQPLVPLSSCTDGSRGKAAIDDEVEARLVDAFFKWSDRVDTVAVPVPPRPLLVGAPVPELIEPLRRLVDAYFDWDGQPGFGPEALMTRGGVVLKDADQQTGTFCFEYAFTPSEPKPPAARKTSRMSGCAHVRRSDGWLIELDATMEGSGGEAGESVKISATWSMTIRY